MLIWPTRNKYQDITHMNICVHNLYIMNYLKKMKVLRRLQYILVCSEWVTFWTKRHLFSWQVWGLWVRLTRSGSRKKTVACTFAAGGWGRQRYLPPRLRGDMATPTAIALDSSFNLLLISRIFVGTNGNGRHHVIIGIVYCWHQLPRVLSRRGAINRLKRTK